MKKHRTYWMKKYAFVLFCYYVIDAIVSWGYDFLIELINISEEITLSSRFYAPLINMGITYSLNVVLAIILNSDIKKLQINAKYAVLCAVIYPPLGISLFLLYVILSEVKKSEQEFETPPSFY